LSETILILQHKITVQARFLQLVYSVQHPIHKTNIYVSFLQNSKFIRILLAMSTWK